MRDLTAEELLFVAGAGAGDTGEDQLGGDIVVTARYGSTSPWYVSTGFNSGGGIYTPPSAGTGGGTGINGSGQTATEYHVVIHDPLGLHDPLQTQAAKNLLDTVHLIDQKLSVLPPQVEILTLEGKTTVGAVLNELRSTVFYVDTGNSAANGGVGATSRVNGHIEDHLDFHSFDGVLSNSNGTDYANPAFNGQGMIGIVLHEIGHGMQIGQDFHSASIFNWRREAGRSAPGTAYYNSAYSRNEERAANDFSLSVTNTANISTSSFYPTYGYGAELPGDLYADRQHL